MNPPEPPAPNNFRYFAIGVLCVAVLLGIYFVRHNAQVDQEREEAAERLALCQHIESVARAALSTKFESPEYCKQLRKRFSGAVAPL
ncbi:hypothetical protein [Pseudomonas costantinii]|uniref:Uncharacterized protein n=1 Tax=Pseudomonas costantinii TaxID=168469 RepID=A0A1S2V0E4_9PSED|nr:hypothetical protein [Pseudomonas costantinii]NVZ18392.1 hypothetical protein [Pseudomonas costantinii]OIN52164.1 hypothetical protein BFL40_14205 [Pseudomonas costantinii]SED35714.1 hypothetical protein SAMN04515675_0829 [Pseudomonas costantinii]